MHRRGTAPKSSSLPCLVCGHNRGPRGVLCSPCDKFWSKFDVSAAENLSCYYSGTEREGQCTKESFRRVVAKSGDRYCPKCRYIRCTEVRSATYASIGTSDPSSYRKLCPFWHFWLRLLTLCHSSDPQLRAHCSDQRTCRYTETLKSQS